MVTDSGSDATEEWRSIVGYEGLYEVSNYGRVRRADSKRLRRVQESQRGYSRIQLHMSSGSPTKLVHRLVAAAFIGRCPDGQQVNHKDGVKANNNVSNLEYVTPAQNIGHAMETGRLAPAKVSREDVLSIRGLAGKLTMAEIGRRYGVSDSTVCRIVNGQLWGHIR